MIWAQPMTSRSARKINHKQMGCLKGLVTESDEAVFFQAHLSDLWETQRRRALRIYSGCISHVRSHRRGENYRRTALMTKFAYETGRSVSFRTHAGPLRAASAAEIAYEIGRSASFRTHAECGRRSTAPIPLRMPNAAQTTARLHFILRQPHFCFALVGAKRAKANKQNSRRPEFSERRLL